MFKYLILISILLVTFSCNSKKSKQEIAYIYNQGQAQGTYYAATYLQPEGRDLQQQLDSFFKAFDNSLSTYNDSSIISRINRNEAVEVDEHFIRMFHAAQKISAETNGAFDITVAPMVNAWGFGFKNNINPTKELIDEMLQYVGFQKVNLIGKTLVKDDPRIMLDASAIAQGLSADYIAKLFEKNGCENYMIDIGGEIVCKGKNPKGEDWKIGIDKPIDDPTNSNSELQTIIKITNKAITTSGNYRKFYIKDGKKYAHTINPKTGYPVEHNLLSATVIADNCTDADAYSTAFMVIGKDSAYALCKRHKELECYLIYTDHTGAYQVIYTPGFKKYLMD